MRRVRRLRLMKSSMPISREVTDAAVHLAEAFSRLPAGERKAGAAMEIFGREWAEALDRLERYRRVHVRRGNGAEPTAHLLTPPRRQIDVPRT